MQAYLSIFHLAIPTLQQWLIILRSRPPLLLQTLFLLLISVIARVLTPPPLLLEMTYSQDFAIPRASKTKLKMLLPSLPRL
ncbi:hypothetical protein B0T25DRAFT_550388 [Lasiosphaeria hispida]|uniref:Uncharacterized protein n=1 Tax=Lasiosphaeria hispida TaxID=260671 RepID=A0AAJ0MA11_9PEZI|nr:hypothetical protein B0T25DRAFT_550388 [Lasiosphaeria hispida]